MILRKILGLMIPFLFLNCGENDTESESDNPVTVCYTGMFQGIIQPGTPFMEPQMDEGTISICLRERSVLGSASSGLQSFPNGYKVEGWHEDGNIVARFLEQEGLEVPVAKIIATFDIDSDEIIGDILNLNSENPEVVGEWSVTKDNN